MEASDGTGMSNEGMGFGICGHRNSYSTGVRCGNWVEDSVGGVLAKELRGKGPQGYGQHRSEAQSANAVDLSKINRAELVALTANEQRVSLQGLPLHLLMGHEGADGPETRYVSTHDVMNSAQSDKYKRPYHQGPTRRKQIRDSTPNDRFATSTNASNREAHLNMMQAPKRPYSTKPAPEGVSDDIPKARRHTSFVNSFRPGIVGLRS